MLTLWIDLCKTQIILSALHFVVKGGRANHYCILPKSKIQTHVTYLKCIVHNIWQHTNNYIHRFGKGNHKRPKAEVSNLYQMNWIIIKIPFNVLIKFEDFCFCMKLGTIYATESNSNSTIRKIRMSEDDLNVNGKLVHCGVNYPYNKIYL